jgi:hypothetical protein
MDALIFELDRRDKMAIVRFKSKNTEIPRFGALLPQKESEYQPAGFNLVFLPYSDDLRDEEAIIENAGFKDNEEFLKLEKFEKDAAKLLI